MHLSRTLLTLLAGGIAGAGLIMACGDDATSVDAAPPADAAGCSCPAAEPPLAGRVEMVTDTITIAAGNTTADGVGCTAAGSILLHGGCWMDLTAPNLTLNVAGQQQGSEGWFCQWTNNTAGDVSVTVQAVCLNPP